MTTFQLSGFFLGAFLFSVRFLLTHPITYDVIYANLRTLSVSLEKSTYNRIQTQTTNLPKGRLPSYGGDCVGRGGHKGGGGEGKEDAGHRGHGDHGVVAPHAVIDLDCRLVYIL